MKLMVFISPLCLLFGAVEYKARAIPSNYAVKRERLERNVGTAEIIVAGSSHAYYGISPKAFGVPAVSVAYPGQDIYYDTRILLKYLSQISRARLIIIVISYHSLESTIEDSEGKAQTDFYYKFWEIPRATPAFRLADYSATLLFGLQRSRNFFLTSKIKENDKIDEVGGNTNFRETDRTAVMNAAPVLKRHNSVMQKKHIALNIKYLNELFSALTARGVKAAMITPPCFYTYYDNLDAERYERMQGEIQALSQKYGLEYGNYLKDLRFDINDFQDSDHLNTKGAEKFSLILKDEVIGKYIS